MSGSFDAVVLAGGHGVRAGAADKLTEVVGRRTLLGSVISAAVAAGASQVILVGPERPGLLAGGPEPPLGFARVREDPPGSGPVAALRTGLASAHAPLVAVLAADLPFLRAHHIAMLLAAVSGDAAGVLLVDDTGRQQWLGGCWRTSALREAMGRYDGHSLHGLMDPLAPVLLHYPRAAGEPPAWLDCDTREDLARAREWEQKRSDPMNTLEEWTSQACAELGLDPEKVQTKIVLDLARDVAHGVARPAAPLAAYLLGMAVGQGEPAEEASERLSRLASAWPEPQE
jgi:molybdopterin-guanine dinucleotide biosynthesis protein A